MDAKYQCPDCGSENAVSKAVAWDALTKTPPKVQAELDRLISIENRARDVALYGAHPGDENTVVVTVRIDDLNGLRAAFNLEPI